MMTSPLNAYLIQSRQQEIAARAARVQQRGQFDEPVARSQPWRRPVLRRRPVALLTSLRFRRA